MAWQGEGTIGSPVPVVVPEGSALDVSTSGARRASAWRLLRQSGKPTDGWLARHIHRRISRVVSYVLLQIGLTAAHAMLVPAAVGLASAWLMAQTSQQTLIAGALLLWFSSVTGGIDGEMARVSLSDSSRGQQLDTLLCRDAVALLPGVMVGWWRQGSAARRRAGFGVALALPATRLLVHMVRCLGARTCSWRRGRLIRPAGCRARDGLVDSASGGGHLRHVPRSPTRSCSWRCRS